MRWRSDSLKANLCQAQQRDLKTIAPLSHRPIVLTDSIDYRTIVFLHYRPNPSTNRKPVCDFLLVINSNWQPISYRCGVIAAYFSSFGHFAFWATLSFSSWAHWKASSGLPICDTWTFFARCYGLGSMGENRSKIGDFAPTRSVWPKISDRRGRPHQ